MRVGFLVNRIEDEQSVYTTTRLARAAVRLGHEAFYMDVESFRFGTSDRFRGRVRKVDEESTSLESFLEVVQSTEDSDLQIDGLDALVLRNEIETEAEDRPWAQTLGIEFGHLAKERGVMVVNDPSGLAKAASKLYLQSFPAHIRPRTLISRDPDEIKTFLEEQDCRGVVKPLRGARGESVFFVEPGDNNLNQIIDAVLRDGYAIAQECLPDVEDGDVRILLIEGEPIEAGGNVAAFRRVPTEEDLRSNMSQGGGAEPAEITSELQSVIDAIAPRLKADGMFFVGIDVMGDKLIEINVESPGGLGSAGRFAGVDFAEPVIERLDKRVSNR